MSDASAFAAAALGALEAAEFIVVSDAFFGFAAGLAALDTAGLDAVDLAPSLASEVFRQPNEAKRASMF